MNEEKTVNTNNREPTTKIPAPRLTSIFGSDGKKASTSRGDSNRRSFAPNLAQSGKRTAPITPKITKEEKTSKPKKDQTKPKSSKPQVVQTKGIFSEGVAKVPVVKKDVGGGAAKVVDRISAKDKLSPKKVEFSSKDTDDDFIRDAKTNISRRRPIQTNDFDDEEQIKHALADTFIDDLPEGDIRPVNLPFANQDYGQPKKPKVPKEESSVKLEDFFFFPSAESEDRSKHEKEEDNNLVFLQLPNALDEVFQRTENSVAEHPGLGSSSCQDSTELRGNDHVLDGFPSGKIGKLQLLKNGELRLKIGDLMLNLDASVPTGFHQELVRVTSDTMYNVGPVATRATATMNICDDDEASHEELSSELDSTGIEC